MGEIVNLSGNTISVRTNPLQPAALTKVNRDEVDAIAPSTLSLMPHGLLDMFNRDEIFDLLVYLGQMPQP